MIGQAIARLHLEHGGFIAPSQAHNRFYCHQPVGCGLSHADAQVLAEILQKFIGATQGSGQVGANLEMVLTSDFVIIKCVKTDNRSHIG